MHNIGIKMKRNKLTKAFLINSNWKSPFGLHGLFWLNPSTAIAVF